MYVIAQYAAFERIEKLGYAASDRAGPDDPDRLSRKLLSLEPETMIAGSAENPAIYDSTPAETDPGSGSVIMEGREVIRTNSAWDNEW